MKHKLELAILPQPNNNTCGPTCLHAVYRFFGDTIELNRLINEPYRLDPGLTGGFGGGTYSVLLANHALRRGYSATIYTFNLRVFDPTWFSLSRDAMIDRLRLRLEETRKPRLKLVMQGFLDFLDLGGEVQFEDLTTTLIRKYLIRGVPILTGLSSTYLYRTMRERDAEPGEAPTHPPETPLAKDHPEHGLPLAAIGGPMVDDDVRGDPQGHCVVLCGYDKADRSVLVADPWTPNPAFRGLQYVVNIDRVICSILLGALTNDADLLILEPAPRIETTDEG